MVQTPFCVFRRQPATFLTVKKIGREPLLRDKASDVKQSWICFRHMRNAVLNVKKYCFNTSSHFPAPAEEFLDCEKIGFEQFPLRWKATTNSAHNFDNTADLRRKNFQTARKNISPKEFGLHWAEEFFALSKTAEELMHPVSTIKFYNPKTGWAEEFPGRQARAHPC